MTAWFDSTAYATADKQVATGTAIQKVLDAQTVFQGLENLGANPPSAYQSFVDIQSGNLSADADHFTEAQVTHEWKKLADGLVASLGLSATMPKESDKLAASKSDVLIQAVNIAFGYLQHLANEESADFAAVLAAPPVLTAEYDYNRPAAAPSNSVFRAIFQKTYRLSPSPLMAQPLSTTKTSQTSPGPAVFATPDLPPRSPTPSPSTCQAPVLPTSPSAGLSTTSTSRARPYSTLRPMRPSTASPSLDFPVPPPRFTARKATSPSAKSSSLLAEAQP